VVRQMLCQERAKLGQEFPSFQIALLNSRHARNTPLPARKYNRGFLYTPRKFRAEHYGRGARVLPNTQLNRSDFSLRTSPG
jgi:hypothetical protein